MKMNLKNAFIQASPDKPLLRGHLHQSAFFIALGASAVLLLNTKSINQFLTMLIYIISLISLFGISALYHRPNWAPHYRIWWKRLDHAAIYFLIAGTGTPIFKLGLSESSAMKMLLITWIIALFGILQSLFWVKAPKWVSAILYIIAGWIIVPFWAELKNALSFSQLFFLILGGFFYTTGAIFYALKRPNLIPKIFGYHELFHLFVNLGAMFHFIVIWKLLN